MNQHSNNNQITNIPKQLVQFFVILDGQSNVAGNDAALFVVSRGVARQFQNLGAQVLQNGGEVNGGTGSHARRVLALTEVTADAAHGELQTGFAAARRAGLFVAAAALSFSCVLKVGE